MTSQYTILIVEDESIVALDLQNRLQRLGYLAPSYVATGAGAIAKTDELRPDLILMDIKLRGDMDGIEASRKIRQKHDVPIIYLTAFADEATLQRAKGTRPFGYLLKPFEERELLATIRMALYRHQAERQLKESEAKFRSIIEQSNDGILLVDSQGRIVEWNAAMAQITGRNRDEVLNRFIWDVQNQMLPDELKPLFSVDQTKQITLGFVQQGEVPPEFQLSELDIQRPDTSRRTVQSRIFVIRRETNNLIASINRDVTEQKQADKLLHQAQKMESLGLLAGGTAHDFNNLLVVILGQSSLALAKMGPNDPLRSHLTKVVQAAEHASGLAQKMLAYSGRGQIEMHSVNLNQIIQDNQSLYAAAIPKHVELQTDLDESLPLIKADDGQIQQIVLNILLNASEAIGDKPGRISLSTTVYDLQSVDAHLWQGGDRLAAPGRYALLEVQDNGCGMEMETQLKVFDPFFTTKKFGRGLGMAAVLGMVRGHRGGVQIESAPGVGTVFRLIFPIIEDVEVVEDAVVVDTAVSTIASTSSNYVLVIDDEAGVREAAADILDMVDIPVLTAQDGPAGLQVYRNRMADIGLVLLDLSMPIMSGEETLHALRQIDPQVQVVLSSGYDENEVSRRFRELELAGFLQKPYNLTKLIETVKRHMA